MATTVTRLGEVGLKSQLTRVTGPTGLLRRFESSAKFEFTFLKGGKEAFGPAQFVDEEIIKRFPTAKAHSANATGFHAPVGI